MTDAIRSAIIQAAQEEGIDPSLALAIADRESNFDTTARNSSTIRGAFQMTGGLRKKYGIGDSDDAYTQGKGWSRFIKDVSSEMKQGGGRDFTGAELYAGHHFGGVRAGRMFAMDPATPVDQVFTAREMRENPHFAKAGSVGNLLGSVTSDIQRRQGKFGGQVDLPDFAEFGEPVEMDFASMGDPVESVTAGSQARPAAPVVTAQSNATSNAPSMQQAKPQAVPDFSGMGEPVV